jgi:cytidyltransferase-like protein
MQKAIIVSGYFNPLHVGHLELFEKARAAGDGLIVIINSDLQRKLKGSKEFMKEEERITIVDSIKNVDYTILSIDKDQTQVKTLEYLHKIMSESVKLAFANGGDQNNKSIPEAKICKKLGIELLDGLGDKIQSSSWLLEKK